MSLEQSSSSAFESIIVDQPQNFECPEATCTPWPSYTLVSYTFIRYTVLVLVNALLSGCGAPMVLPTSTPLHTNDYRSVLF